MPRKRLPEKLELTVLLLLFGIVLFLKTSITV
jgi:hypothetical protein